MYRKIGKKKGYPRKQWVNVSSRKTKSLRMICVRTRTPLDENIMMMMMMMAYMIAVAGAYVDKET
jgi:hypothetical protein